MYLSQQLGSARNMWAAGIFVRATKLRWGSVLTITRINLAEPKFHKCCMPTSHKMHEINILWKYSVSSHVPSLKPCKEIRIKFGFVRLFRFVRENLIWSQYKYILHLTWNLWHTYGVAWVVKCHGSKATGAPLRPQAFEVKELKIYLPAKYNYLKLFIAFSLFNGNFLMYCH
jgi:hypothetical protein